MMSVYLQTPYMRAVILSGVMIALLIASGCTGTRNIPGISSVYTDSIYNLDAGFAMVTPSLGGATAIPISNTSGKYHVYAQTITRDGSARIYYSYKTIDQKQDRFGIITEVNKACDYDSGTGGSNCLLGKIDNYNVVDRFVKIPQGGIDFSVVVVFEEHSPINMNVTKVMENGNEMVLLP